MGGIIFQSNSRIRELIRLLRPHHWIKNIIIFAAPLFALELYPADLLMAFGGFLCFSLLASAFYAVNDISDVEEDRMHPVKSNRPIARGSIPIPLAWSMAVTMALFALAGAFYIHTNFGLIVSVYAVLQILYNWQLKHRVFLDIMVIALGFVLRALSGAVIVQVPASGWFLLCVGFLALFLGIEKRKAELKSLKKEGTRSVLEKYDISWLRKMENVVTSAALISYSLWTVEGKESKWFLLTIPFVIYVIFRYQQLSETRRAENPELILLQKPGVLVSILLWGGVSLLILLLENDFLF